MISKAELSLFIKLTRPYRPWRSLTVYISESIIDRANAAPRSPTQHLERKGSCRRRAIYMYMLYMYYAILRICIYITSKKSLIRSRRISFSGQLNYDYSFYFAIHKILVFGKRIPFSSTLFLALLKKYFYSFEYFYCFSSHTRTYCKNPHAKMSIFDVFMSLWKSPKLDLGGLFFF